jgi:hypothetical protein
LIRLSPAPGAAPRAPYDTHDTERYMDHPERNPDGYRHDDVPFAKARVQDAIRCLHRITTGARR